MISSRLMTAEDGKSFSRPDKKVATTKDRNKQIS